MSFRDENPWVSGDEYMDDQYYVQVTEKTDTPEKAIQVLADHPDDPMGTHGEHADYLFDPAKAKVTYLRVSLPPEGVMGDSPIWVSRLIRTTDIPAFWEIDCSEALEDRPHDYQPQP